jgi:hypothetical protein
MMDTMTAGFQFALTIHTHDPKSDYQAFKNTHRLADRHSGRQHRCVFVQMKITCRWRNFGEASQAVLLTTVQNILPGKD